MIATDLSTCQPRRIAIIKPSAMGDVACSLPVLTALRRRFPDAHITWIVNRTYAPLLDGHPDLDDIIAFERFAFRHGVVSAFRSYAVLGHELRRRRFDVVIDLQGLLRTGLMTLATAATCRIGLQSAREGARWSYTHVIPAPPGLHAVDRYLLAAGALGCDAAVSYSLTPNPEALAWVRQQLGELPRPWIAAAVGARWSTKRWPPAYFADLLGRADAAFGGTAIFLGGRDEIALTDQTAQLLPARAHILNLTAATSLPQLAAVLSRADVLIANDTGPLHLAVALGRPVVAPYTCTQTRLHGPHGQLANAVETTVDCRGSYRRTCSHMKCLAELTPDRLWPVLRCVLQTASSSAAPHGLTMSESRAAVGDGG